MSWGAILTLLASKLKQNFLVSICAVYTVQLRLCFFHRKQECIPVGCVPAAYWPYARVCFRGQNSWHTLLKILPWPNFVAGGNNAFNGIQCTCSHDEIVTMALNPRHNRIAWKQKQTFSTKRKRLFTWSNCNCDFFIATNGLYEIQCKCSYGATSTMGCSYNVICDFSFATNG